MIISWSNSLGKLKPAGEIRQRSPLCGRFETFGTFLRRSEMDRCNFPPKPKQSILNERIGDLWKRETFAPSFESPRRGVRQLHLEDDQASEKGMMTFGMQTRIIV